MRLRYAGVDVLLDDPDGRAAEYLRRYLSTENMRHWIENPMWRADDRQAARFSSGRFVGLPTANFSEAPPVEINTLYWPSGASRWARCLLLINDEQWSSIRAEVYVRNENLACTLEWWDEENHATTTYGPSTGTDRTPAIKTEMFCLPPRPVTVRDWPGAGTGEKLYLLPLVDARYWWQFRAVEEFQPETWDEAFTLIEDAIGDSGGFTIQKSTIPWIYGRPSSVEFRRDHENAAMLLDAIAACVGHRIVRKIDGTVLSQSTTDAQTAFEANLAIVDDRTAGGERADYHPPAMIPESFRTTFKQAGAWEVGEVVTKTAEQVWGDTGIARVQFGGTHVHTVDAVKSWHCTAEVTTTTPAATTTPAVTTTLAPGVTTTRAPEPWEQELTRQLAIDWIDWQSRQYDITIPGLIPWTPTGYDDWIEWCLGRIEVIEKRRLLLASTRVQSVPPNCGTEELPIEPIPGTTTTTTTTTTTAGPTTTPGPTTTTPDPCETICSGPGSAMTVSVGSFSNVCYPASSPLPTLGPVQMLGTAAAGSASGSGTDANGVNFTFSLICAGGGVPAFRRWVLSISPTASCVFGGSSAIYVNSAPTGTFTLQNASGSTTPPATVDVGCGNTTTTPTPTTTVAPTTTATPTTTTAAPCTGDCDWSSTYDADAGTLVWNVVRSGCTGACSCEYPPDCPTAPGQTATTDCIAGASSPPAGCTTATPTTTTLAPCTSFGCAYRYNGSGWDVVGVGCRSGCNCSGPPSLGFTPPVGHISNTPCAAPPTTTAAPTTTTAAPCAGGTGTLVWQCNGGAWEVASGDGTCDLPDIPAEYVPCEEGAELHYDCATCVFTLL